MSCSTPRTTDTGPCSRTARAASTAPLWSSRCSAHLEQRYPDRFRFVDHTLVDRVVVGDGGVVVHARSHAVDASAVVLCTNGFVDHVVEDAAGGPIGLAADQRVDGHDRLHGRLRRGAPRIPAALSYIRNTSIGGDTPYVYVTRRTYDRPDAIVTLTCMGGPEHPIEGAVYDPEAPFPGDDVDRHGRDIRPFAQPARPPGPPYDFQWHGLMGYTDGGIRVIGPHPATRGCSTTSAATASASCHRSMAANVWRGSWQASGCRRASSIAR